MEQTELMIAATPIKYRGKRIEAGESFDAHVDDIDSLLDGSLAGFSEQSLAPVSEVAATGNQHLIEVIGAIVTLDENDRSLFTKTGKPKTEAIEALPGIDFEVSAALRDEAWQVVKDEFNNS